MSTASTGGRCLFWQSTVVDGSIETLDPGVSGCALALPLTAIHAVLVLAHALGLSVLLSRENQREGRRLAYGANETFNIVYSFIFHFGLSLTLHFLLNILNLTKGAMTLQLPLAYILSSMYTTLLAVNTSKFLSQMGALTSSPPFNAIALVGAALVLLGTLSYRSRDEPEPPVINSVDASGSECREGER